MTESDVLPRPTNPPQSPSAIVKIGLGRALRTDHVSLIAADEWGLFAKHNVDVVISSSQTAASALINGDCDLALIESVELLDLEATGLATLGCVVRNQGGGMLMREDRLSALCEGDRLRVASLVPGQRVEMICRRILQGWAAKQGFAVAGETIRVDTVDLSLRESLAAGYDGVWLSHGLDEDAAPSAINLRLLSAKEDGLPELTGLELVARGQRSPEETTHYQAVIAAIDEAALRLQENPHLAIAVWQQYTQGNGRDVEQALIHSLQRVCSPIDCRPERWQELQALR